MTVISLWAVFRCARAIFTQHTHRRHCQSTPKRQSVFVWSDRPVSTWLHIYWL